MKRIIATLLFLMLPVVVQAQATGFDKLTPALPTAGERKAADITSAVLVGAIIALDTKASWDSSDRRMALSNQAARLFATWTMATLAKGLTHRTRPDGSNDLSFYSMHTAFAFQALGGPRATIVLPVSVGVGGLRIAAGKHWLTDVLVGAGVGAVTSRLR